MAHSQNAPFGHLEVCMKFFPWICLFIMLIPVWDVMGQPGNTDIFLLELRIQNEGRMIGTPVNITKRSGYDNQPQFTPDGKGLLYTSIREDNQSDIYRYDIIGKSTVKLTSTEESEYSPTMMPGGKAFSVVRVEADQAQRLWGFDLNGGNPRLLLKEIKPVGYHAWCDENCVALFVLGDPPTLQLANLNTGESQVAESRIGRSLHRVPGSHAISFVHKVSSESWLIKKLDLSSFKIDMLCETLPHCEDYAWMPDGNMIMGKGLKLYQLNPKTEKSWREIADFTNLNGTTITRIAVSPQGDLLAFVVGIPSSGD